MAENRNLIDAVLKYIDENPNPYISYSDRPCLWHLLAGGEVCTGRSIEGVDYCRAHIKVLELLATRRVRENGAAMGGSKTYLENLIIVLLTAAGTATGQVLINNWDAIWSKIGLALMTPPALVIAGGRGQPQLIARFDESGKSFMGYGCEMVSDNTVVRNFLSLAPSGDE